MKICLIDGCAKKVMSRGWCSTHYQRWKFHGDPAYDPKAKYEGICEADGCDEKKFQRGFCRPHYFRWRRHGDPLEGNASRIYTKETRKLYLHQHYLANKQAYLDRAKAQPREKTNEYKKKWKLNNPAQVVHHGRMRHRRLQEATPKWLTPEQWAEMNMIYVEAKFLTENTGTDHHVDHIVPLTGKGVRGLHVPWNLRVLTARQNMQRMRA